MAIASTEDQHPVLANISELLTENVVYILYFSDYMIFTTFTQHSDHSVFIELTENINE